MESVSLRSYSDAYPWHGQVKNSILVYLFHDKDKLFGNRTSKNFDVLARGTSEYF